MCFLPNESKLYLLPPLKMSPYLFLFFLYGFKSDFPTMAPRVPQLPRPSPLTNRKLLNVFKGKKPNQIKFDDICTLGTRYMQKTTSIRFVS